MRHLGISAVLCVAVFIGVPVVEGRRLLKLAAAAAIIRGGPVLPLPIKYKIPAQQGKDIYVPYPVPVKVKVQRKPKKVRKVVTEHHYHHHHVSPEIIEFHDFSGDHNDLW